MTGLNNGCYETGYFLYTGRSIGKVNGNRNCSVWSNKACSPGWREKHFVNHFVLVKVSLCKSELECFENVFYMYSENMRVHELSFSSAKAEISGLMKKLSFTSTWPRLLCWRLLFCHYSERKAHHGQSCLSPGGVSFINRIYMNFWLRYSV